MAVLAQETIVGTVGSIHDKRNVGQDNTSVIDFSVGVTPRKRDGNQWVDGETYWVPCTAWGRLADNIEQSFRVGDRVFVHGRKDMKPGYTTRDGEERPARPFLTADFAGLELFFDPAHSTREVRGGGGGRQRQQPARQQQQRPQRKVEPKPVEDLNDDDYDLDFDLDDISVDDPF